MRKIIPIFSILLGVITIITSIMYLLVINGEIEATKFIYNSTKYRLNKISFSVSNNVYEIISIFIGSLLIISGYFILKRPKGFARLFLFFVFLILFGTELRTSIKWDWFEFSTILIIMITGSLSISLFAWIFFLKK